MTSFSFCIPATVGRRDLEAAKIKQQTGQMATKFYASSAHLDKRTGYVRFVMSLGQKTSKNWKTIAIWAIYCDESPGHIWSWNPL
jgi:hypothetical protein